MSRGRIGILGMEKKKEKKECNEGNSPGRQIETKNERVRVSLTQDEAGSEGEGRNTDVRFGCPVSFWSANVFFFTLCKINAFVFFLPHRHLRLRLGNLIEPI